MVQLQPHSWGILYQQNALKLCHPAVDRAGMSNLAPTPFGRRILVLAYNSKFKSVWLECSVHHSRVVKIVNDRVEKPRVTLTRFLAYQLLAWVMDH